MTENIPMPNTNAASPRVEIYTGPHCGYCHRAKALLVRRSLAYREHDVSKPHVRAAMLARLPGARAIPQIFIDGEHIGGSDDLAALDASGALEASRAGTSNDARAAEAVKFAKALAERNGDVGSAEILAVRNAGYGDAENVEIITHVGMNVLTNILGKASRVEIDFPRVELKLAA